MRVIAGKWRGRRLRVPPGREIRPTADRVKEALFSILMPEVPGAVFLDLCCGAGGLAIEALSRGARQAILVDTDRRALQAAEANLLACGAQPDSWRLVRQDALEWFERWTAPTPVESWLVVADPPYGSSLAVELGGRILSLRAAAGFRGAVLEHQIAEAAAIQAPDVEIRSYGGSCLSIFRPLNSSGP